MDIYTAMCKIDCQWEAAVDHRELSSKLCDDLDGEMGAGRLSMVLCDDLDVQWDGGGKEI